MTKTNVDQWLKDLAEHGNVRFTEAGEEVDFNVEKTEYHNGWKL
jgi:hypothetical protein